MVENFLRGHLVAVLHAVVAGRCLLVDPAGVGVHVEELARREDLPRPQFVVALEDDAVEDFDIIEACDELVAYCESKALTRSPVTRIALYF